MEVTGMDNDTRGWIMTVVSGIACIVGASVICVDLIICRFPGKKNFKIQESNAFLASSLSLSFGVMLFTSLYGMLPSSKKYLLSGGLSKSGAAWTVIGCFTAGFIGIQVVSRLLHSCMPSHVVDCDHDHNGPSSRSQSRGHSVAHSHGGHDRGRHTHRHLSTTNDHATEESPLLPADSGKLRRQASHRGDADAEWTAPNMSQTSRTLSRRPSVFEITKGRVLSFVKDTKSNCDVTGPCFGYSDPCGQECYKHVEAKLAAQIPRPNTSLRTNTGNWVNRRPSTTLLVQPLNEPGNGPDESEITEEHSPLRVTRAVSRRSEINEEPVQDCDEDSNASSDLEAQHHHHVPKNAFASIGIQTSVAIALHKIPEGFITYASNHANPSLGFSVFMALFVHNITEGFALALPIYLAWNNRLQAMIVAFLLGGLSQPIGAGVAALWFRAANNGSHKPGERFYGCMFGVTAGIMTSVALQLFVESLTLNHNRNLCITFAFLGMAIIGVSNALTA
ncbi:ZIP Zinc transporter [Phlyctema vagabunda]|uniref:ZIP Zinc transporter n=1 Tax=Phlyctema vagabunda TaxID=108571 RepID=A0ABR4P1Z3_9HELO